MASCQTCQEDKPKQARTIAIGTNPTECMAPMQQVATDLLDTNGQKWLVLVVRFASYACLKQQNKMASKHVIDTQTAWLVAGPQAYTQTTDCSSGPRSKIFAKTTTSSMSKLPHTTLNPTAWQRLQ